MRGSLSVGLCFCGGDRIIPAHAGLTSSVLQPLASSWDHPRACGAHWMYDTMVNMQKGSSPRMRGSLKDRYDIQLIIGIIPAHAGLTGAPSRCCMPDWDHPRACGAHLRRELEQKLYKGSSPRMRGSPHDSRNASRSHGIIPAHAGLTARTWDSGRCRRDHPRACGAHNALAVGDAFLRGSSPRMRGSLKNAIETVKAGGIIPAHAGLT